MALLVHQQFAVDAFVALSSKTPDPVCTDGTVGSLLGRADGGKSSSQTHYIPGDATEALLLYNQIALCHHHPSLLLQSIQRQITSGRLASHSLLITLTKL